MPAVVSVETSDIESVASLSSTGSVRTAIPRHILKKLFGDIEHAGGLHEFDNGLNQALNILLDRGDPAIYGARGEKQRKRLSNKVTQWKSLPKKQYHRRLYELGLTPAASIPPEQIRKLRAKEKTPPRKNKKKKREISAIPEEVEYESPPVRPAFTTDSETVTEHLLEQAQAKRKEKESKTTTEEGIMRGTSPVCLLVCSARRSPLSMSFAACFKNRKHYYHSRRVSRHSRRSGRRFARFPYHVQEQ